MQGTLNEHEHRQIVDVASSIHSFSALIPLGVTKFPVLEKVYSSRKKDLEHLPLRYQNWFKNSLKSFSETTLNQQIDADLLFLNELNKISELSDDNRLALLEYRRAEFAQMRKDFRKYYDTLKEIFTLADLVNIFINGAHVIERIQFLQRNKKVLEGLDSTKRLEVAKIFTSTKTNTQKVTKFNKLLKPPRADTPRVMPLGKKTIDDKKTPSSERTRQSKETIVHSSSTAMPADFFGFSSPINQQQSISSFPGLTSEREPIFLPDIDFDKLPLPQSSSSSFNRDASHSLTFPLHTTSPNLPRSTTTVDMLTPTSSSSALADSHSQLSRASSLTSPSLGYAQNTSTNNFSTLQPPRENSLSSYPGMAWQGKLKYFPLSYQQTFQDFVMPLLSEVAINKQLEEDGFFLRELNQIAELNTDYRLALLQYRKTSFEKMRTEFRKYHDIFKNIFHSKYLVYIIIQGPDATERLACLEKYKDLLEEMDIAERREVVKIFSSSKPNMEKIKQFEYLLKQQPQYKAAPSVSPTRQQQDFALPTTARTRENPFTMFGSYSSSLSQHSQKRPREHTYYGGVELGTLKKQPRTSIDLTTGTSLQQSSSSLSSSSSYAPFTSFFGQNHVALTPLPSSFSDSDIHDVEESDQIRLSPLLSSSEDH